ncbi:shikimate dehydrogenase [Salibacter sp.]|uniref:shikimate dehydrogenase family protein n=1 Tax=Salibacter sp. TaxID=2010995 RepID=UPI002870467E|nr:shikimate dehydrogenase [Salibacter sp.]MDR9398396.1 shikimate dehydrogenase [Salibacter sp.]MDR9487396.1 shikimate dehydrogenase [Salibacter sp.]
MKHYGLIGKTLNHSFSPSYFNEKFKNEHIDAVYELLEKESPAKLKDIPFQEYSGLNVTIPYKTEIIALLDNLSYEAREIGAVNTIAINENQLIGHNTDWIGFKESIEPLLIGSDRNALIFGTGGASKAVSFALNRLNISYELVSRSMRPGIMHYDTLTPNKLAQYDILINTTPVGTKNESEKLLPLHYEALQSTMLVYDLVYNPRKTELLKRAELANCRIKSGYEMLEKQAEASWKIWNQ